MDTPEQNPMPSQAVSQDEGDEISLIDLAATLWRRKWLIIAVTCITAVASVVYALMQPNIFTASATMLPISGSSSSSLAQYAGLAALAGVNIPASTASTSVSKIEAIIKSRTFAEKLVQEMNLAPRILGNSNEKKNIDPNITAVEVLQGKILNISTDAKTSLIKVSAKTKDPTLSSDIANKAVELLQLDLTGRALTSSEKNRILLEQQVVEQEEKVKDAQNKMTAYQKKYKFVAPQPQNAGNLQMYQSLIQQKMSLEMEIARLENTLSYDNPRLNIARSNLEILGKQIKDFEVSGSGVGPSMNETPAALMEYANLSAELELATKIYGGLVSSLESIKIQEASEKVYVEVIDTAIPPQQKSEPSRAMICVVGTMAGGFLSVLLAFVMDALKKLLADPEVRAKFSNRSKEDV